MKAASERMVPSKEPEILGKKVRINMEAVKTLHSVIPRRAVESTFSEFFRSCCNFSFLRARLLFSSAIFFSVFSLAVSSAVFPQVKKALKATKRSKNNSDGNIPPSGFIISLLF